MKKVERKKINRGIHHLGNDFDHKENKTEDFKPRQFMSKEETRIHRFTAFYRPQKDQIDTVK